MAGLTATGGWVVFVLVWALPFLLAAGITGALFRLLFRGASRRTALTAVLLAGCVVMAAVVIVPLDPWPDLLFASVLHDDAQFAPQYSAWGFWSVRRGMTMEEVARRAGPPLERYKIEGRADEEGWRWTRSPHDSSYRVRAVIFRNGKVAEKVSEFYVD